jgi:uncharacterized RDD family membrane protein YckC
MFRIEQWERTMVQQEPTAEHPGERSPNEKAPLQALSTAAGWSDISPHPWRRWIARLFDFSVVTAIVFAVIGATAAVLLPAAYQAYPAVALGLVFLFPPFRGLASAVINAALLRWISTTPGKWLCGIRIVRKDGAPMTFGMALMRELEAYALGCGIFFPVVVLVAMAFGFARLRREGATAWDEHRELVALQRPNSAAQFGLASLAVLLHVAVQGVMWAIAIAMAEHVGG